jgi:hypothetical protein
MSNVQKPASASAKVQKLMLFPGDPLIKTLKPDYYIIVDPGSLSNIFDSGVASGEGEEDLEYEEPEDPFVNNLKAPSLSDITLVSKNMITDKNNNQFIEFVFNVKNSGGDTVIGAEVYGQ